MLLLLLLTTAEILRLLNLRRHEVAPLPVLPLMLLASFLLLLMVQKQILV